MILLGLIILCLAAPTLCYAEAPRHLTMDEILVVDEALSEPSATVVGTKSIERGKNIIIPDAIRNETDIDIRRKSVVGDNGDVLAIRGLSANRIMLNVNGRTVNAVGTNGGHYIDWATIPLDNIERIEVIRGGSSVIYGNNAIGGVINVFMKRPTDKPTLSLYGNYGGGSGIDYLQNYRITHSYKIGPIGYSFAASYQKAAPFLWNNDFEGKNVALSLYIDMPLKGELNANIQYANSVRGYILQNRQSTNPEQPGFFLPRNGDYPISFGDTLAPPSGNLSTPGPGARWDKKKIYLDGAYKQPIGDLTAELRVYKNIEDRNERNYSWSLVNSKFPDGQLVLDRDLETDRSYGGTFTLKTTAGAHDIVIGADYKVLAYGQNKINLVDRTYNAQGQTIREGNPAVEGSAQGYFVQDTWAVTNSLLLTGGLRYDIFENKGIYEFPVPKLRDTALTPKLTATYRITSEDAITASAYQALRTPGIPETYWWYYGVLAGSPALKPEKNTALEIIYQHDFNKRDNLRLSAYHYSINDYIMFRSDPNWRGVYNIDKVKLYGLSGDVKFEAAKWLTLRGNINYQRGRKEGDPYDTSGITDKLDYLPEWKANAGFDIKLPCESLFGITARYVGSRQTLYSYTSAGQARFTILGLESFITADMNIKIPVTKYGEINLYADNLFNKRYEELYGYPLPGRIIGASLKVAL